MKKVHLLLHILFSHGEISAFFGSLEYVILLLTFKGSTPANKCCSSCLHQLLVKWLHNMEIISLSVDTVSLHHTLHLKKFVS